MKTRISRRGTWHAGRWTAQARWREDSRLLIVERVEVWLADGRLLGRVRDCIALADMRAIDRLARLHAEAMLRKSSAILHDGGAACLQAA